MSSFEEYIGIRFPELLEEEGHKVIGVDSYWLRAFWKDAQEFAMIGDKEMLCLEALVEKIMVQLLKMNIVDRDNCLRIKRKIISSLAGDFSPQCKGEEEMRPSRKLRLQ